MARFSNYQGMANWQAAGVETADAAAPGTADNAAVLGRLGDLESTLGELLKLNRALVDRVNLLAGVLEQRGIDAAVESGELGAALTLDDPPGYEAEVSGNDWQGTGLDGQYDGYHDVRDCLRGHGQITVQRAGRGVLDDFSLEYVDSDGDLETWQATEPGDYLEYEPGLNQIRERAGSRWYNAALLWLHREACRRGDVRRIADYEARIASLGLRAGVLL